MADRRPCDVDTCAALVEPGARFCALHKRARTAKELRLGPDKNGLGAVHCTACRRAFRDADFVDRQPVTRTSRAKEVAAYVHVRCDPPAARPNRKQLRDAPKPLLEQCDVARGELG